MPFDINGKVALITGGASGIGLNCAKVLLRNGLRGVTLADFNPESGAIALKEIEKEFGPNKAIFLQTDVTDRKSFEDAFDKTIGEFKNVDILVNNAGMLNDALWEKEVATNINGVIHGMLLGLEHYIPKHKSGTEGVIVNMSSVAGVQEFGAIPVYTATKFAVLGMSKAWGLEEHYQRTKVKVLALCPGLTSTRLVDEMSGRNLGPFYENLSKAVSGLPIQDPKYVGLALVQIIRNARSGGAWVVEDGKDPYEYVLPARESFAPH